MAYGVSRPHVSSDPVPKSQDALALVALPVRVQARGYRQFTPVLRASVPLLMLVLWSAASASGLLHEQTLPAPAAVWRAFARLVGSGVLWDHLSISLQRASLGLVWGASVGLTLGLVTGLYRIGDLLLDPLLQMLRMVPFLAVAPLLVLWFGIDERQKLLLLAFATGFPFYLNTHGGVRGVDHKLLEAARVFGVSRLRTIVQIVLPSALPQLLVGLRQSFGAALIALIVAEQTNAPRGIGFLMMSAQQFFEIDVLLMCIVLYGLWGLLADLVVRGLERLWMPWRFLRVKS